MSLPLCRPAISNKALLQPNSTPYCPTWQALEKSNLSSDRAFHISDGRRIGGPYKPSVQRTEHLTRVTTIYGNYLRGEALGLSYFYFVVPVLPCFIHLEPLLANCTWHRGWEAWRTLPVCAPSLRSLLQVITVIEAPTNYIQLWMHAAR